MTYYATRVQETLSWNPRLKRKTRGRETVEETRHLLKVLFLAQLTAAELLRAAPELSNLAQLGELSYSPAEPSFSNTSPAAL
jgi:hypothetical protein